MTRSRRHAHICGVAAALCALAAAPAAHAQLVTSTFTKVGTLYHYNYTVTDNTPTEFIDITLFLPTGTSVMNFVTPAAFTPAYDPRSGYMDFIAGTSASGGPQDFTPGSTFSGFMFDSTLAPQALPFGTTDLVGNFVAPAGMTLPPAAVPEPGTLGLALLAVPGLLLSARRRRAATTPDRSTQGDHTA